MNRPDAPSFIDGTPPHASPAQDRAWRRSVAVFLAVFFVGLLASFAFVVVLDPYDSGRFPAFMPPGVSDDTPRTANLSRGRDRNFNSVVIGNSHVQLLDPARLSAQHGLKFVQMAVPGTGPREQITLLHWFMRHHSEIGAVVIGTDTLWCTHDPELPPPNPFPFWLYGDFADFLPHALQSRAVYLAGKRILVALNKIPRTDPAGYSDYEKERDWNFKPQVTNWPIVDLSPERPLSGSAKARAFPGINLLEKTVLQLPAETPLLLVFPPMYRAALPEPNSSAVDELVGCKQRLLDLTARRPNTALVDFLYDAPPNRKPENYMDNEHYRAAIAREIERRIAQEIAARSPALRLQ